MPVRSSAAGETFIVASLPVICVPGPLSAGLLRVLGCVGNATAVHLFGFNWSAKHYFTHQMSVRAPVLPCVVPVWK